MNRNLIPRVEGKTRASVLLPGESIMTRTGRRRVLLVAALAIVASFAAGQLRGLALGREAKADALRNQAARYAKTLTACSDVLAIAAQLEQRPGWREDLRVVALSASR